MIPYSTQTINNKDINSVVKTMKSSFLTQGPKIKIFEKLISKKVNSKYTSVVNSATSALHISCMALNFKKGDILWTTPNTFSASSNCALHLGGKVNFVDINPFDNNVDINLLEKKLKLTRNSNLPKIFVPVHFSGNPVEQDKIYYLSKKYNFKIIEDASHALGAIYKNEKVGSCRWSDITVFSFHPVKIITTFEGGAATTNNKKIYEKLKLYSNHGITKNSQNFFFKKNEPWYYEQQLLGLNYRLTDVAASLGISQIKNLQKFIKSRNNIAKQYEKKLDKKFVNTTLIKKNSKSSFHLYVIKLKDNVKFLHKKLFLYLRKKKINVNLHYIPVHLHPYYRKLGFKKGDYKFAEDHATRSISLPIFPGLKKSKVELISKIINNFLKNEKK